MATAPVEIDHPPATPAKPCGVRLHHRTVCHEPMRGDIEKYPNSLPMRLGNQRLELRWRSERGLDLFWVDASIAHPDVEKMMRTLHRGARQPDSCVTRLLCASQPRP